MKTARWLAVLVGVLGLAAGGRADPPADLPYAPKSAKVWTTADPHGFAALKWAINGILGRPTYAAVTNINAAAIGASGTIWRAEWTAGTTNEAALREIAVTNEAAQRAAAVTNEAALRAAAVRVTTPFTVASMTEAEQFWRTTTEPALRLPDGWIDAGFDNEMVDSGGTTGLTHLAGFGLVNYENVNGSAASFDGVGTHSIDIPFVDGALDWTGREWSVSFWCNVPDDTAIGRSYTCPLASTAQREGSVETGGFMFLDFAYGTWGGISFGPITQIQVQWAMDAPLSKGFSLYTPDGWGSEWHHWVYSYNKSRTSAKVFEDGHFIGLFTPGTYGGNGGGSREQFIYPSEISKWVVGRTDDLSNTMYGGVDDVAMWNRALSDKEAQTLYGGGRGHPYDASEPLWMTPAAHPTGSGLLGYWPMNEGSDTNVADVLNLHNGVWTADTANWRTSPVSVRGSGTEWTYRSRPHYLASSVSNVVACYWLQSTNALAGLTNWLSADDGATWTQTPVTTSGASHSRRYVTAQTTVTAGTALVMRVTYPGTEPCELRGVSLRGK
jgi:hypothetical protein